MRIFITGINGFIGSWLARELRSRHHEVFGCDLAHGEDETAFSIKDNTPELYDGTYVRADVSDFRQLERAISHWGKMEIVYHCAAEFGRWNGEDFYEQLWRTNAIGTKNVLMCQRAMGFKLVFFSTSEIYGDVTCPLVEAYPDLNPIKPLSDYALSKWVGEMQVYRDVCQSQSLIVRLFNVYGPGECYSPYRSVNCRFIFRALHDLPLKVFQGHRRTSTYVLDAVNALANLTTAGIDWVGRAYNISSSCIHTIEDLAECVVRVTGSKSEIHSQPSEPMTIKEKWPNTDAAATFMGMETTVSLENGIAQTAKWMREHYRL